MAWKALDAAVMLFAISPFSPFSTEQRIKRRVAGHPGSCLDAATAAASPANAANEKVARGSRQASQPLRVACREWESGREWAAIALASCSYWQPFRESP